MPEDDYRNELLNEVTPPAPSNGVRVYDRPTGLRMVPPWAFILVALLIVAALWVFFTYAVGR